MEKVHLVYLRNYAAGSWQLRCTAEKQAHNLLEKDFKHFKVVPFFIVSSLK